MQLVYDTQEHIYVFHDGPLITTPFETPTPTTSSSPIQSPWKHVLSPKRRRLKKKTPKDSPFSSVNIKKVVSHVLHRLVEAVSFQHCHDVLSENVIHTIVDDTLQNIIKTILISKKKNLTDNTKKEIEKAQKAAPVRRAMPAIEPIIIEDMLTPPIKALQKPSRYTTNIQWKNGIDVNLENTDTFDKKVGCKEEWTSSDEESTNFNRAKNFNMPHPIMKSNTVFST